MCVHKFCRASSGSCVAESVVSQLSLRPPLLRRMTRQCNPEDILFLFGNDSSVACSCVSSAVRRHFKDNPFSSRIILEFRFI